MNEFLQISHASEQTEPTNSVLLSFFTILGIIFLVGVIFQEAKSAYAQPSNNTQQIASVEEK